MNFSSFSDISQGPQFWSNIVLNLLVLSSSDNIVNTSHPQYHPLYLLRTPRPTFVNKKKSNSGEICGMSDTQKHLNGSRDFPLSSSCERLLAIEDATSKVATLIHPPLQKSSLLVTHQSVWHSILFGKTSCYRCTFFSTFYLIALT